MCLERLSRSLFTVALLAIASSATVRAQAPPTPSTTEWRFSGDTAQYVDSAYGPATLEYGDGDGGETDTNDVFGVTDGQGSERVEFCIACHELAGEELDHLFFPPEAFRKKIFKLDPKGG